MTKKEAVKIKKAIEYFNKVNWVELLNYVIESDKKIDRLEKALEEKNYCKYANKCNSLSDFSREEYEDMCQANMRLSNKLDNTEQRIDKTIETCMIILNKESENENLLNYVSVIFKELKGKEN